MKLASKWIVVPFREIKSQSYLSPKEKISKIINNPKINKIDKLKLVNQILLIQKQEEKITLPSDSTSPEQTLSSEINQINDDPNYHFTEENFLDYDSLGINDRSIRAIPSIIGKKKEISQS